MRRSATWFAVVLASATVARAQAPVGPEFRVNAYTTGFQSQPNVAVGAAGDFVVVWLTPSGGGQYAAAAQRFAAGGARLGSEFVVSDVSGESAFNPRVALDASGAFVVAWVSVVSNDASVRARRFDPGGVPRGPSFPVNTFTSGAGGNVAVAGAADGRFVVVWDAFFIDGQATGIGARRFDAAGAPVGGDFIVNTATGSYQGAPDVAMSAAGDFVVVWTDASSLTFLAIAGQRFTAAGARNGAEFRVDEGNSAYANPFNPHVAMADDGAFAAAWQGDGQMRARRFDPLGAPLGGEIVVAPSNASEGALRFTAGGRFTVAWRRELGDGSGSSIAARAFAADGSAVGPPFRVNASTTLDQDLVTLGSDAAGNVVAAWTSEHEEGRSVRNIFAQRLGLLQPRALAVDTAAGATSDGNHVLEPGEQVDVRPSWTSNNATTVGLSGALSALAGPAATYVINDAAGSYGSVAPGATQACVDCYAVSVSAPSGRPALHWDATAIETINPGDEGHTTWTLHVGDSFSDVPRGTPFYRFVETLLHRFITGGCGVALFCPGGSATRAQMAPFLLVSLEGAGYTPRDCRSPSVFADVPPGDSFCAFIEELARRGVTGGCGGGNYCPNDAVTREQMAVFLLRTLDPTLDPPACTTPVFNDVPASSGFCRWIEELVRRGITAGCGGGNYCPGQPVTRGQMAVFLTTTFGLSLYGP